MAPGGQSMCTTELNETRLGMKRKRNLSSPGLRFNLTMSSLELLSVRI